MAERLSDKDHFHKDCVYFEQCKITEVREGGHNYIDFLCPMVGRNQRYYKADFLTHRWGCRHFVPKQPDLNDYLGAKENS